MDPKDLSQLDPKLREAYERVMGSTPTPTPGQPLSTTPSADVTPPPMPSPPPQVEPRPDVSPVHPPMNEPVNPAFEAPKPINTPLNNDLPPLNAVPIAPSPDPNPAPATMASSITSSEPAPAVNSVATAAPFENTAKAGGKKVNPVIIGVALVVFLFFWAILWMVLLKLKTPFS
jgi:hypothetical protein